MPDPSPAAVCSDQLSSPLASRLFRRPSALARLLASRLFRRPSALASLLAFAALAAGCGDLAATDGACTPGDSGSTAVWGTAAAGDPRFVGPGMRGASLPHRPMFHHDGAHSGRNSIAPTAAGFVAWTADTAGEVWSSPSIGLDGVRRLARPTSARTRA